MIKNKDMDKMWGKGEGSQQDICSIHDDHDMAFPLGSHPCGTQRTRLG